MKYHRIIPRLDIKGPNLVKGIHLEGLRVLGDPEKFAYNYYIKGADELIYQDVVASLYQRNSLLGIVKRTSDSIFIPLTVGGGIRNLSDINDVLRSGADKVAINTAAINNPKLINEASKTFGSSTIVISIEYIKQRDGSFLIYTDNGRESTGIELFSWIKEVEDRGAGEVLLTSIDKEGTGKGGDVFTLKKASSLINIPIIGHGGIGSSSDIIDIFKNTHIDGVSISSLLHYEELKNINSDFRIKDEGNYSFLRKKQPSKLIKGITIESIKSSLINEDISVRCL